MSLIAVHLEQIAISCDGINSLPFARPKIFANALLANHDITALIRDTEAHERALFSVPPPASKSPAPAGEGPEAAPGAAAATAAATTTTTDSSSSSKHNSSKPASSRRQTVFNVSSGEVTAGGPSTRASAGASRRNAAVAAVLGGDLHDRLLRGETAARCGGGGDVDVEVLLRGAEKLCGVYAPPGAPERIAALRSQHASAAGTTAYYEGKVAEQTRRLGMMRAKGDLWDENEAGEQDEGGGGKRGSIITEEDLRREEEEVRQLEKKKRELQAQVKAMEKDLGGLRDMGA